MVGSLMFRICW